MRRFRSRGRRSRAGGAALGAAMLIAAGGSDAAPLCGGGASDFGTACSLFELLDKSITETNVRFSAFATGIPEEISRTILVTIPTPAGGSGAGLEFRRYATSAADAQVPLLAVEGFGRRVEKLGILYYVEAAPGVQISEVTTIARLRAVQEIRDPARSIPVMAQVSVIASTALVPEAGASERLFFYCADDSPACDEPSLKSGALTLDAAFHDGFWVADDLSIRPCSIDPRATCTSSGSVSDLIQVFYAPAVDAPGALGTLLLGCALLAAWRRSRRTRRHLAPPLAILALTTSLGATPAPALTITTTELAPGETFESGAVAEPRPTSAVGGGSLASGYAVAARRWESIFPEPFEIDVTVGWLDLGKNYVLAFRTDTNPGIRWSRGYVGYATAPERGGIFLDPTPLTDEEYGAQVSLSANLGGGTINTGRFRLAAPPAPMPTTLPQPLPLRLDGPVFAADSCSGNICGTDSRFLGRLIDTEYGNGTATAMHEIGHFLGLANKQLSPTSTSLFTVRGADTVVIRSGPFKGMEIPTAYGVGRHMALNYPDGVSLMDPAPQWLPFPDGRRIYNVSPSDAEIVLIGALGDWHVVRLPSGLSYATYPRFVPSAHLFDGFSFNGASAGLNGPTGSDQSPGLHLTPDRPNGAGSAFLTAPFAFGAGASFRSSFSFEIGGENGAGERGADGLAFVLHNDPRGAGALGAAGLGLGYGNVPGSTDPRSPIAHSLALEFDTHANAFDPDGNHVAVVVDGRVDAPLAWFDPSFLLGDGEIRVWVDYDSSRDLLSVFMCRDASETEDCSQPDAPQLTASIDLDSILAGQAWFGFTAATGDGFNSHDVMSWELAVWVPEPPFQAVIFLATAAIALLRARRPGQPH